MAGERILIVEDEGIVAADLESLITKLGYKVVRTVPTGEEAIEQAEILTPDLILMDIRLKGEMDGIEAAEQITAQFNIPVTYLTAYADERTLERAKTTMPYGYILKPFEEKDLRTAIELALYKHQMESMTATIEGWHATALRSIPNAMVATDKQGRITFMNERAETMLGRKLQDIYGKTLDVLLPFVQEAGTPLTSGLVGKTLVNAAPLQSQTPVDVLLGDGRKIHVNYEAGPIKDDKGQVTGILLVLHDSLTAQNTPRN